MRLIRFTLTTKTLLRLTIASFCISLIISFLELSSYKEEAYLLAHSSSQDKVDSALPALRSILWGVDSKGIHNILDGLTKSGAIVEAELVSFEEILIELETIVRRKGDTSPSDLSWSVPIIINDAVMAELRITESYGEVRQKLSERRTRPVGFELLKAGCLGVLLFFIVYRTITRHLITLARGIARLKSNSPEDKISLDRRSTSSSDELDALVAGINQFHSERALPKRTDRFDPAFSP